MATLDSQLDQPALPSRLTPEEFLRWMATDLPGLYLLGCLNRHITVHSQQRRAINLIYALREVDRHGLDGKSLAIVGAGFAGLTAAAFALKETKAEVSLFDAAPRPLWIQDNCRNRWLHPGINDWPLPGSLEPCTSLPVLNWRAGVAGDVAFQVRSQWDRIAATNARLSLRLGTRITGASPSNVGQVLLSFPDGQQEPFDIVVLALGFGLESGALGRAGYWNDADGLDVITPESLILIGGFGDSALSDVLRLCLPDIRQENLIELVRHVPAETCRQLIEWERGFQGHSSALDELYRTLRVESVIRILEETAPASKVVLAGKGNLYGPRSTILNRFLVSQLYQARGESAFRLITGPIDETSLREREHGEFEIRIGDQQELMKFAKVVLRLGPEATYTKVSPLSNWGVGEERRKHWYEMPQSLDRTRVPLWERTVSTGDDGDRPDVLAYESSSRRWCLVLHPQGSRVPWTVYVTHALEEVRGSQGPLNVQPLSLPSENAIATPAAVAGAVRALCAAEIVVADVTDFDPSVMLLLGVRAVVRRSVTIACTERDLSPEFWKDLPFNLKELNIVSFARQKEGQRGLVAALQAGLSQSAVFDRYLDLPVYDYVRTKSVDVPTADAPRVLLLRRFVGYTDAREVHVSNRIKAGLRLPPAARVEAIIDQTSPRLAGQRLYEAIRHWKTCVVDLTSWRPNVLFELGVRLAVRPRGTYCLIDEAEEGNEAFPEARAKLKALVRPFVYDLETPNFRSAFEAPVRDYIYEAAVRHFRTAQDRFHESVDMILIAAAAVTPGHDDPLQAVDVTPLYAVDHETYADTIRHSVFEKLYAAWCCMADRDEPHKMVPLDLLDPQRAVVFRRFASLGSQLKAALAHRYDAPCRRLRARIEDAEQQAKTSGTIDMAELLGAWESIRRDPPWKIDVTTIESTQDWTGLVEDCENQLVQLRTLEERLEALANPVCALPLQGVRSDCARLQHTLEQFNQRNL